MAMWSVTERAAAAVQGVQILSNINAVVSDTGTTMETLAFVTGLGSALWGIHAATFGRRKRQAQEESLMVPIMAIVGGVLLSTLIYTMGSVSATLFGTNQINTQAIPTRFQ